MFLQFKGRLDAADNGAVSGDYGGSSNVPTSLGSYHHDKEINCAIMSENNSAIYYT